MHVCIKRIEYFFPEKKESNTDLKADNPDWRIDDIIKKTGIVSRRISSNEQTATDLAEESCKKLINSGLNTEDIDFIILVTQSPDYALPTSACILQDRLGVESCIAFDINLGCSGFVYGLAVSSSLISSGLAKQGILVCSDTYTKYIDKHDRTCRPLFSDAAAATHISISEVDSIGPFELGTDGSGYDKLIVPSSGARINSNKSQTNKLFMSGADVFMFTMDMVPKAVNSLLIKSNKKIEDIDLFIFHQASKLVIDSIIRRLDLPEEKVFMNFENIGNTVSATIPIALSDAIQQGRINTGDLIMLVGFGVGYSWGGCLIQWP
jgi:3-oxoacyl-[acyl-carrier-protein] synthase-3